MQLRNADRRADELDRFYGHLATFTVVALMALLLGIANTMPPGWIVAVFAAWGTVLACQGLRARHSPA